MPNKIWPSINHNKIKVRPLNTTIVSKHFYRQDLLWKLIKMPKKWACFGCLLLFLLYLFNRCHFCLVNHWLDLKREREKIIWNLYLCKIHYCVGAQLNYVKPLSVELTAEKSAQANRPMVEREVDWGRRTTFWANDIHECRWCIVRFPVV